MKQRSTPALWVFWGSIGFILYTYIGFPLLVALRGLLRPRPVQAAAHTPMVSLIIAAYNEADVIIRKLENAHALDYPHEQLEIIVASDGSNDGTAELVANYDSPLVRLVTLPRQGKNRTLNTVVPQARGEILVFSDADSMLEPVALHNLIAPFADPEVGGVAGDFHYTADLEEGAGEQAYWSLDRVLKQLESQGGNVTSATGQLYAVRRELFATLPSSVTDDFYTSTQAPAAHQRLVFEPKAMAYGAIAASSDAEFRRKVRVMTRGLRGVWLMRRLLNPFEHGFYAVQLMSHKVFRRLVGIPLLAMLLSAPLLWRRGWFYQLATLGQLGLHGAAGLGYLLRNNRLGKHKLLSLPFFFDMVNIAALIAAGNLLRGRRFDVWDAQRAASPPTVDGVDAGPNA